MWTFTPDSFTSAVYKKRKFQIRARDKQSLLNLGYPEDRIITGVGTDYPFRVYSSKREYKRLICKKIDAITYDNFKNEAKRVKGKRYAEALGDVWLAMLKIEPRNARQLLAPYLRPGNKVAKWWPEYAPGKGSEGENETGWEAWDAYESAQRQLDRDTPELELTDDEPLDNDELAKMEDEYKSLHDYTDAEWAKLMGDEAKPE